MIRTLVVLFTFLPTSAPAQSQSAAPEWQSAAEMRSYCEPIVAAQIAPNGKLRLQLTYEAGICWGAISSLQTMVSLFDEDDRLKPIFGICLPARSTLQQAAAIFSTFAEKIQSAFTSIG